MYYRCLVDRGRPYVRGDFESMSINEIISRIRRGEDSVTQFKRQAIGVATIASFASKELPYRGLGTGVKRAVEVIPDIQFESDRDANWLKAIVRRTMQGGCSCREQGRHLHIPLRTSAPQDVI